jgi:glycosyltransferase involved in cell wall biosynthesis
MVANNLETFGGGEKWILDVASRMQERYDITLIDPVAKQDKIRVPLSKLKKIYKIDKVKIVKIDCFGINSQIGTGKFRFAVPKPKALRLFDKTIRTSDVVYEMSMNPLLLLHAIASSKLYRKRFILGLQNPIFLKEEDIKSGKATPMQGLLLKGVCEIHAMIQTQVEMLRLYKYKGKIHLLSPFFVDSNQNMKRQQFKKGQFTVLFVGRFDTYQKGIDLLEMIMLRTIELDPTVTFSIVGTGSKEGEEIVARTQLKYPKNIKWHKFVSDSELQEQYSKANLFILPSRYESPGMGLLEAQSYGIPAIGFKVQGPKDSIQKKIQGSLITTFRVNDFAKEIIVYKNAYKKDPAQYNKRTLAIREMINSMYSEKRFMREFAKMIDG